MAQDQKGGPGSGNFGHVGIPGHQGGSGPSGGGVSGGHSQGGFGGTTVYDHPNNVEPEVWSAAQGWGPRAADAASRMRDSGRSMIVSRDSDGNPDGALSYRQSNHDDYGSVIEADYAVANPKSKGMGWRLAKVLAKESLRLGAIILVSAVVSTVLFPPNFQAYLGLRDGFGGDGTQRAIYPIHPDTLERIARSSVERTG